MAAAGKAFGLARAVPGKKFLEQAKQVAASNACVENRETAV